MAQPVQHSAMDSREGFDGQLYLDEASRLAADFIHLQALWLAEARTEEQVYAARGEAELLPFVRSGVSRSGLCPRCNWARFCDHQPLVPELDE